MKSKILENNVTEALGDYTEKDLNNDVARVSYSKSFHLGLCSTCNLATTCTFPSVQKSQKVTHCEEFDARLEKNINEKVFLPFEQDNITTSHSKDFLGLCKNCEKRNFCSLTKPLSGIWHCEEYE